MECSLKYKKLRHSGVGRNPACHITSRSGQSRVLGVVPLVELLAIRLGCQPKNFWPGTRKTSAKSLVMRGDIVNCLDSGTLTSILSRLRERRRSLFPPLGESWIEGRPE